MQSNATSEDLVLTLISQETTLQRTSELIKETLDSLVRNSTRRIEAVIKLETIRLDRERILQLEHAIQQRNSEVLEQTRREIQLQENWAVQAARVRQIARAEGVILDPDEGRNDSGYAEDVIKTSEEEWDAVEESVEELLEARMREERAQIYRLQLAQIEKANVESERHVQALLNRLKATRSLATTRIEMARLASLSNSTTVWLAELSLERNHNNLDLDMLERQRFTTEAQRDYIVLDLILRWSEQRRLAVADPPIVPPILSVVNQDLARDLMSPLRKLSIAEIGF